MTNLEKFKEVFRFEPIAYNAFNCEKCPYCDTCMNKQYSDWWFEEYIETNIEEEIKEIHLLINDIKEDIKKINSFTGEK